MCYKITFVGWNAAHPYQEVLGFVRAASPERACMLARKLWPCGNGQEYRAELVMLH